MSAEYEVFVRSGPEGFTYNVKFIAGGFDDARDEALKNLGLGYDPDIIVVIRRRFSNENHDINPDMLVYQREPATYKLI